MSMRQGETREDYIRRLIKRKFRMRNIRRRQFVEERIEKEMKLLGRRVL